MKLKKFLGILKENCIKEIIAKLFNSKDDLAYENIFQNAKQTQIFKLITSVSLTVCEKYETIYSNRI